MARYATPPPVVRQAATRPHALACPRLFPKQSYPAVARRQEKRRIVLTPRQGGCFSAIVRGATIAPLVRKRSARQGEASPYAEPLAARSGVPAPSGAFVLPPRRSAGRTGAGPPMTGRAALDPAALRG